MIRRTALSLTQHMLAHGCVLFGATAAFISGCGGSGDTQRPVGTFDPTLDDARLISSLSSEEQQQLCREASTFGFGSYSKEEYCRTELVTSTSSTDEELRNKCVEHVASCKAKLTQELFDDYVAEEISRTCDRELPDIPLVRKAAECNVSVEQYSKCYPAFLTENKRHVLTPCEHLTISGPEEIFDPSDVAECGAWSCWPEL